MVHCPFMVNDPEQKETGRVEAFSDGVFAIAVTLLVLDLKVPHRDGTGDLLSTLLGQWPTFVAFFNSFVTILIVWLNHHNLFNNIKRTDNMLMLSNGLLLLCTTFLPFPTSLVSEYFGHPGQTGATILYTGTFLLMACAFNLIWRYASYEHRLLSRSVTAEQVESINRQYLIGPAFYGLAFALSFVNVTASLLLTIMLAAFYGVTASMSRK
jgi:uncharacterized membrane protein